MNNDFYSYKEGYTEEIKKHVESAFELAVCMDRMQLFIDEIRENVGKLPVKSELAIEDNRQAVEAFDKRMQRMVSATFDNMERYKTYKWQELFNYGEDTDG